MPTRRVGLQQRVYSFSSAKIRFYPRHPCSTSTKQLQTQIWPGLLRKQEGCAQLAFDLQCYLSPSRLHAQIGLCISWLRRTQTHLAKRDLPELAFVVR